MKLREKFGNDMIGQAPLDSAGWKFWYIRGKEIYFNKMGSMECLWKKLVELGAGSCWITEDEVLQSIIDAISTLGYS